MMNNSNRPTYKLMLNKKRYKGTIKFFSYERGYGFLVPHDTEIKEDGK